MAAEASRLRIQEPRPSPRVEPTAKPAAPSARRDTDHLAATIGDVVLLRLYTDAFPRLDARGQLLAYHLASAVLAGNPIAFDQLHRRGLEIRRMVEIILRHNMDMDPRVEQGLSIYLQQLWVHGGFFDRLHRRKFVPPFTFEQWARATRAASSVGAELDLAKGEPLEARLSDMRRTMFDPAHEPILADPKPQDGADLLAVSHLNLYDGVTLADLARFKEAYPQNSRLIRIENHLVEEVFRQGDVLRKIPPGRYSEELRSVIKRLHDATVLAPKAQRKLLGELIEHLRSGDPAAFAQARAAMAATSFEQEFAAGFLDTHLDPRGLKGVWSGIAGIRDPALSARLTALGENTRRFEERMPWGPEDRRSETAPPVVAVALELLVKGGQGGPICEFSYRLPGPTGSADPPRASKAFLFTNVLDAYTRALGSGLVSEFCPARDRAEALALLAPTLVLEQALRAILGRELGRSDGAAKRALRNAYEPMVELKAALVALWLMGDPLVVELGWLPGEAALGAAYRAALTQALAACAVSNEADVLEPAVMARRMLLRFLLDRARVVLVSGPEGHTALVIPDARALREAVGTLLTRVGHALATADRPAALQLILEHGSPPRWSWQREWRQRAQLLGLRRIVACINPKLTAQRNPAGQVERVLLTDQEPFERQILRYRLY